MFAVLDAVVQISFIRRRGSADAALPSGAGAPFRRAGALYTTEDVSFGDDGGGAAQSSSAEVRRLCSHWRAALAYWRSGFLQG